MEYDYPSFRFPLLLDRIAFGSGPYPGDPFPDFDLPTADGSRITRAELIADGPALITLSSFTCPMAASAGAALRRLHGEFDPPIAFMTLYVREAYPGSRYPQPDSIETKLRHARSYIERDQIPWPVAVDDAVGTLHRQLDRKPNSAYILGPDGTVLFRSLWSNHEWTLREALAVVAAGGTPMEQREPRLLPMLAGIGEMHRILELSGADAKRDVLFNAPPLYLMARLARSLPFAGPLKRGLGALGMMFGLGLGGMIATARARRRAPLE